MTRLKFKAYQNKYYWECVNLVKATWNFHQSFEGIKDENLVYEYYLRSCLNWNAHQEIIVDEDDHVKGLLFGSKENESYVKEIKYMMQDRLLQKWLNKHINDGDFGDVKCAKKIFKLMKLNDDRGEKYAHHFDSEINLFIVSPDMRGQGLGIRLMDHYMAFCDLNNLKRAFLWTDEGCSYSFYEKYGFNLHSRFQEGKEQKRDTGMIFYIDVNAKTPLGNQ